MDSQILEKIGLTKSEIKVYFALLKLGNSTTGPIIKRASIARSKVYDVLEKLKQKGLVSESINANIKYFQASNPKRILDYINEKEKKLQKEKIEFKKILPDLIKQQKNIEERQEVKVYVGKEGLKTFYNELLDLMKKDDEYFAITFRDNWKDDMLKLFFQKFHTKRAQKKCYAKILYYSKDEKLKPHFDFSKTGRYQIRSTTSVLPTGVAIFRDMVAMVNWGKTPKVFVIISKTNARHYKDFFHDVWKKAK